MMPCQIYQNSTPSRTLSLLWAYISKPYDYFWYGDRKEIVRGCLSFAGILWHH